ncbi:MAG TPA: tetratricopeptide repeat protein, partial [Anaerolineales bacterium]|nr:tetratricopeptide repeat protein [Anaerolineales bacterium]
YIEQGKWDAATEAFSDALSIAQQTGERIQIAGALHGLARVAAAQGDIESASKNGKEALGILEAIGHRKSADVRAWLATLDPCQ